MTKKSMFILLGLIAAVSLTACSNKDKADEPTAEVVETAATEQDDLDDEEFFEDETESEIPLEPIVPSDYLVKNPEDYISTGKLVEIPVTKYTYEITDDMVQERIQSELESCSEEVDVDRASETGDIVYVDLTSTIKGDEASAYTESTYFALGDEEYGADFDKELTGVKPGDTKTFSIAFDEDCWIEEWVDQTVEFEAKITSVSELSVPEYNDDFLKEYTDFTSKDEYEDFLRESLESEYEDISYSDTVDALYQAAIDDSIISTYPEELYDSCKAEMLSFYASFAGTSDEQEIYEMFGIEESDLEAEILSSVNRRLLISAIAAQNNLEVTEDEYLSYVEEYAPYYGYASAYDFESDYSREALVWSLYDTKAGDALYETAKITEEPYTEDFSDDDFELIEE